MDIFPEVREFLRSLDAPHLDTPIPYIVEVGEFGRASFEPIAEALMDAMFIVSASDQCADLKQAIIDQLTCAYKYLSGFLPKGE